MTIYESTPKTGGGGSLDHRASALGTVNTVDANPAMAGLGKKWIIDYNGDLRINGRFN